MSNYAINHIKSSYVIKSLKEKELKTQKAKATDGHREIKNKKKTRIRLQEK